MCVMPPQCFLALSCFEFFHLGHHMEGGVSSLYGQRLLLGRERLSSPLGAPVWRWEEPAGCAESTLHPHSVLASPHGSIFLFGIHFSTSLAGSYMVIPFLFMLTDAYFHLSLIFVIYICFMVFFFITDLLFPPHALFSFPFTPSIYNIPNIFLDMKPTHITIWTFVFPLLGDHVCAPGPSSAGPFHSSRYRQFGQPLRLDSH